METKALLAVVCWLTFSDTFVVSAKTVNSSKVQDNQSEASAPRLYRNVPAGVYASAAPYGAYSIQFPSFISAPKAAASHAVPVKQENIVFQNANGYLKDSYGNRFVDAPQMISYKTAFPQQFVQLQELPAHLAQPLVAAAPSFQFKQLSPQHFVGSNFRQPSLQGPTPTPINSFVGSAQPLVYAGTFRSVAPSQNQHAQVQGVPTAQQQSTSNKAVYVNQAHQQYNNIKSEPKFQRLQEAPRSGHVNSEGTRQNHHNQQSSKLQAAPAKQTAIHTIVNGEKTVINLETSPPLPLLDISLLEPLTFANPLVPQVQHFLPRINQATYHKLPQANIDAVNYQKEFVVKKTKSYDSGNKGKKPIQKKKPKKQQPPQHEILDEEEAPPTPTVTFKGTPNDGPEFSYEINSPTYKETYKEKAVRYNKETNSEPVHYTYGTKTQNEPVTYSYAHNSKEPMQIKQIHYESNGKGPTQLIYNFNPDEQLSEHDEKSHDAPSHSESEDSRESSEDADEGSRPYHQNTEHKDHHEEVPRQSQNYKPEHREEYHLQPKEEYQQRPKEEYHQRPKEEYHQRPKEEYQQRPKEEYQQRPKEEVYLKEVHHSPPHHNPSHQSSPHQNIQHHSNPHQHSQHQNNPHHINSNQHGQHHNTQHHSGPHQNNPHQNLPQHYPQPIQVPVQAPEPIQAITQEYEENIRIIPTHSPNAHIKVDPGQHVHYERHHPQSDEKDTPSHSSGPPSHQYEQNQEQRDHHPSSHINPEAPAHIHEKSKKVIIQEETPDEMHSLREQMIAEMIDQEENNEEDFEKAYKDAAYGFPAFSRQSVDVEKDIFNPGLYGIPREHTEYDIEHTPFQQYQEEGDEYPKASRLTYKDTRDKTKDDYYLDYSVNKPESFTDLHSKKVDYYKLFKQSKPERHFADKEHDNKKKENHSAKYTALPTFEYYPAPQQKPKQFAQYKAAPQRFEYDYSKGTPRDNSAFASRPHHNYRSKTHFVEPQFQYGFEPISIPRLLDSELAAMASNNRPESEKPGMRKKVYKENWYIKKTSTSGGEPAS